LLDRQRIEYSLQLTTNHGFGLTGFALGQRLANADHRNNAEFQRAQCLGSHYRVGFAMVGTTLGMADERIAATKLTQHRGSTSPVKAPRASADTS
jgi:hypothetical protein